VSGAGLAGFFNSAALAGSTVWISTYFYDRAVFPPGELRITSLP